MKLLSWLRRPFRDKRNLYFDLPIAQRLTLGFLSAALIATVVASGLGFIRTQSLNKLSSFYQSLLNAKTNLTFGETQLELMNNEMRKALDLVHVSDHSQEMARHMNNLDTLARGYGAILSNYEQSYLLDRHPDQVALLNETDHSSLIDQQKFQMGSAERTWQDYYNAQQQVLHAINDSDAVEANNLIRLLLEPFHSDARSALHGLAQTDGLIAASVNDSVQVEERDQLLATIFGAAFAFISIILVGLFISHTLVRRLKQLRQAAQAAQDGKLSAPIKVIGHDEIADISSSVNAMLQIIALEKEAGTASELRDQFIASVSHELRNPLAEVYGWLELLRDFQGKLDTATQMRYINNATYGCQDLMHLINNVLDSTRLGQKMKTLQLEVLPVAQIVRQVIEQLDPRETQRFTLRVDIAPRLTVWADQQYLRQILRNLLSNALKYSPEYTTISVSAALLPGNEDGEPGQVCISVQDAGPGIPADELPNLFQKFTRLKRDTQGIVQGTGLGLYISKQLVEAMEGRIWAKSSGIAGDGSCFSFTLPEPVPLHPKTAPLPEAPEAQLLSYTDVH